MKYLLVLGFACDIYKKQPKVRIIFNNNFIDEFEVNKHIDTYTATYKKFNDSQHILKPIPHYEYFNLGLKHICPLRLYEIDLDDNIDFVNICLDIENNDSNYSNGFQTRSTLLQLKICSFFPINKELISRFWSIAIKKKNSKNCPWYWNNPNTQIFNLLWNALEWQGKERIKSSSSYYLGAFNVGGNGRFSCKLFKKYGVFISKLPKYYNFFFNIREIDFFLNKYKTHANQ